MCEMCYGYIYDCLLSPLSRKHILSGYIHTPSLMRCVDELTKCFERVVNEFDNDEFFFINLEDDDLDIALDNTHDINVKEYLIDEFIWNKFNQLYSKASTDLEYAIQICLENSITRNVFLREQFITQFCMFKLRLLLVIIPELHKDHTEKRNPEKVNSSGPVPLEKITKIRSNLGLPISNWQRETLIKKIMEEDPLYQ